MSYVMIATGRAGARVRTLPASRLWLAGTSAALALLGAGVGLGCWISAPAVPSLAVPQRTSPALPFAIEQLGTLSGRLFKLESLAKQLNDRLGTNTQVPAGRESAKSEPGSGRGGPMLPPRDAPKLDIGGLHERFERIEALFAAVGDATVRRSLQLMRLPTRLPIEEPELTSTFGNRGDPITGRRAFHAGLDFAAGFGTAIRAAAGGTVSFAGFRPDYGWMVELDHGNGLRTRYAHASKLLASVDTLVAPGEVIARSGSSGRSTGPHLHFEVLRNGEPTDPRRYLAGL
jgi:murein DD-endopeptidase MepM/ murein hydrolase activator NlpD